MISTPAFDRARDVAMKKATAEASELPKTYGAFSNCFVIARRAARRGDPAGLLRRPTSWTSRSDRIENTP